MPAKRLQLGSGETSSVKASSEGGERLAKEVRALFTKYHKGKREAAMQQLEELNAACPSGLACLALCKLQVLQGVREAVKEDDDTQRQEGLLQHVHAALSHALRGASQHRSLSCMYLAAVLGWMCRGHARAAVRVELWRGVSGHEFDEVLKQEEGWADPASEGLPLDLATDRWPQDFAAWAARHKRAMAAAVREFSRKARTTFQGVLAGAGQQDLLASLAESGSKVIAINVGSERDPLVPLERRLLEGGVLPEAPVQALRAFLASLEGKRKAAQGLRPLSHSPAGGGEEEKERPKVRLVGKGEAVRQSQEKELRARREEMGREAKRKAKLAEVKEAQARAAKVAAFLESKVGGVAGEGRWEALCSEASLPMAEYEAALGELERRGALAPEQVAKARQAAGLMARGQNVYYAAPAFLRSGMEGSPAAQRAQQGAESQSGGGPVSCAAESPEGEALGFEEMDRLLRNVAWRGLDMEAQKRAFAELDEQWALLFEHMPAAPLGPEYDELLLFEAPLPSADDLEVLESQGELERLLADADRGFQLPVDILALKEERMPALDMGYKKKVLLTSLIAAAIPALGEEPAASNAPAITQPVQRAKHLLAQCLLGHCMLREARAGGREGGAALGAAARFREARELASKQSMGKLVALAAESKGAQARATECMVAMFTGAGQREGWAPGIVQLPVESCAQLGLALLAPGRGELPSDPSIAARERLLEVKRRVAGDILLGLRLLQQHRRLYAPTVDYLLKLLCGGEAAPTATTAGAERPGEEGRSKEEEEEKEQWLPGQYLLPTRLWSHLAGASSELPEWDPSGRQHANTLCALGRLALRDLMRVHAFLCLLLAWHFPQPAGISQELQEAHCILAEATVPCEATDRGMLHLTPFGLLAVAQREHAAEEARKAGGPQAGLAALRAVEALNAAAALALAGGALEPPRCELLAGAACQVAEREVELSLLSGPASQAAAGVPGSAAAAARSEQDLEAAVAKRLALVQQLMALRSLMWGAICRGRATMERLGQITRLVLRLFEEDSPDSLDAKVTAARDVLGLYGAAFRDCLLEEKTLRSFYLSAYAMANKASQSQELAQLQALLKQPNIPTELEQVLVARSQQCEAYLSLAHTGTLIHTMDLDLKTRRIDREQEEALGPFLERLRSCSSSLEGTGSVGKIPAFQEARLLAGECTQHVAACNKELASILCALAVLAEALHVWECRLLSALRGELCAHACAKDVGIVLLQHMLPAKWEAESKQARGGGASGPAPPATSSRGERTAAEQAAAALLEEEKKARQAQLEKEEGRRQKDLQGAEKAALLAAQQRKAAAEEAQRKAAEEAARAKAEEEAAQQKAAEEAARREAAQRKAAEEAVQRMQQLRLGSAAAEPGREGSNAMPSHTLDAEDSKPSPSGWSKQGPRSQHKGAGPSLQLPQQLQELQQPQGDGQGASAQLQPGAQPRQFPSRMDIAEGDRPLPSVSSLRKGPAKAGTGHKGQLTAAAHMLQGPSPRAAGAAGPAEQPQQPPPQQQLGGPTVTGASTPPISPAGNSPTQNGVMGPRPAAAPAAPAQASPRARGRLRPATAVPSPLLAGEQQASRQTAGMPMAPETAAAAAPAPAGALPPSREPPAGKMAAGRDATGHAAAPSGRSQPLQDELAAQLEAARAQGLLGADGEIDISKLAGALDITTAAAASPQGQQPTVQHHRSQQAQQQQQAQQGEASPTSKSPVRQALVSQGMRPPSGASQLQGVVAERRPMPGVPELRRALPPDGRPPPPQQQLQQEVARFVRWEGDWMCRCGWVNPLRDDCKRCRQWAPCRDWFRNACRKQDCAFPHLPFDLPATKPPTNERGTLAGGMPIAQPPPGALYKKPRAAPSAPLKPAIAQPSAWHQPPEQQQQQQQHQTQQQQQQEPAHAPAPIPAQQAQQVGQPAASSPWARWPTLGEQPPEPSREAAVPRLKASVWQQPSGAAGAWAMPVAPAPAAVAEGAGADASSASNWALPLPDSLLRPASTAAGQPVASTPAVRQAWGSAAARPAAAGLSWAARAAPVAQQGQEPDRALVGLPELQAEGVGEDDGEALELMLQSMGISVASEPEVITSGGQVWSFGGQAPQALGQDQEDADLQAAVQASLQEAQQRQLKQQQAWLHLAGKGGGKEQEGQQQLQPAEMEPVAPALANAAGEYNCFLNVIIQCLWYCSEFKRQVSAWPAALYSGNAMLSALRSLFLAFTEEEVEGLHNRTVAAGSRQPVDPTPLREALAALPQGHLFRQGEMSDAAEVLDAMYGQIRLAAAAQGLPSGVDELFGLGVREAVECSACHRTTHQASYTQFFFNTQATAIRMQRMIFELEGVAAPSLGRLLRLIEQQARKTCDTDMGGCGALNPITHFLQHGPRVFTLQLAWESHHEEGADIDATLAALDEQVDLGELFQAQELGQHVYRLRSMVCYYGAHYQAFVLVPQLNRWLVLDDTRVANVGAWEDVRLKCSRGRTQPCVLFFEKVT